MRHVKARSYQNEARDRQGYVLQLTQDSKFTMMDPSGMDALTREF
jgi:hypothetical protein